MGRINRDVWVSIYSSFLTIFTQTLKNLFVSFQTPNEVTDKQASFDVSDQRFGIWLNHSRTAFMSRIWGKLSPENLCFSNLIIAPNYSPLRCSPPPVRLSSTENRKCVLSPLRGLTVLCCHGEGSSSAVCMSGPPRKLSPSMLDVWTSDKWDLVEHRQLCCFILLLWCVFFFALQTHIYPRFLCDVVILGVF